MAGILQREDFPAPLDDRLDSFCGGCGFLGEITGGIATNIEIVDACAKSQVFRSGVLPREPLPGLVDRRDHASRIEYRDVGNERA